MRKYVILFVILTLMLSITANATSVKKPGDGSDERNICPERTTCDLPLPIRHHLHPCVWNFNCKPNFQCCHTSCSPNKICVPFLNTSNIVLETNVKILANDDDNVKIILNQDNQTDKNIEHLSNHHKHIVGGHTGMIVNVFHHIIKKYYIKHLNVYYGHNNNVLSTENINESETTTEQSHDAITTERETSTENIENVTEKSQGLIIIEKETEDVEITEKPYESIIEEKKSCPEAIPNFIIENLVEKLTDTDTNVEKESCPEAIPNFIIENLVEKLTETDTNVEKPDESVTEKETIEITESKKNHLQSCTNTDDEECLNSASGLGIIPEIVGSADSVKDEESDSFSGSGDINLKDIVNVFDPKDSIMFKTSDGKIVIIGDEIQMLEEPLSDDQKCNGDNDCKNSEIEF